MKKPETATARIKVKPSLLKKLKILAAQRQMSIGKLIEYEIFVAQN